MFEKPLKTKLNYKTNFCLKIIDIQQFWNILNIMEALLNINYIYEIYMTGFKLMVTLQSECVPEILKLCRMNKIFF